MTDFHDELRDVHQAVKVGTKLALSWFRGHSTAVGELTPRIFRAEYDNEMMRTFRPNIELTVIERFKRDARAFAQVPLPADNDLLGWLYVMQHYLAPTRLLDWTESVLVALYFAVHYHRDQDGELWALYPTALNAQTPIGPNEPLVDTNRELRFLIREPYWAGTADELARELDTVVMERPVAFPPRRNFPRMVAQSSMFTIHPRPRAGHTIPEIVTDDKHLVRYKIPAGQKRKILENLHALKINHHSLFQDLEALSKLIEADARILAYGPPEPPRFRT